MAILKQKRKDCASCGCVLNSDAESDSRLGYEGMYLCFPCYVRSTGNSASKLKPLDTDKVFICYTCGNPRNAADITFAVLGGERKVVCRRCLGITKGDNPIVTFNTEPATSEDFGVDFDEILDEEEDLENEDEHL